MGKFKRSRIICPLVYYDNGSLTGVYIINFRGSMEYSMRAMSGSDLGQTLPNIWTAPLQENKTSARENLVLYCRSCMQMFVSIGCIVSVPELPSLT